ncbi:MAG: GNAT family N-acetyltransferase, partial [Pyrinomonadaceae bacterium]
LPAYEGQGFGTESARALLNYGREMLNFTRLLAITTLDNDASVKLLEKLGFKFQRRIKSGAETLRLFSIDLNS